VQWIIHPSTHLHRNSCFHQSLASRSDHTLLLAPAACTVGSHAGAACSCHHSTVVEHAVQQQANAERMPACIYLIQH
jgi:hypothetical protein